MATISGYRKLAFLRLGDVVWTPVESNSPSAIADIVYLNGQFYAITVNAKLLIVDISNPRPKTIEFAEPPEDFDMYAKFYLVESVGELFMVAQDVYEAYESETSKIVTHETDGFDVYKFGFDNRKWTQVKRSLDNRALFVGFNASFAIFPSDNHLGCEPNCIYYTDIDTGGLLNNVLPNYKSRDGAGKDMGVFRMETEELDDHYVGPDIISRVCAPLWICPSFSL
ncbi:putative F-box protein At5g55150 [Telopea speciosissima]|uniref:putative F-box protein At5g55150 n=1 Tax=Telopea speciosissima TaxID=54955 RepID=UPI001CC6EA5A|nr:putative F-box protein At5g55150 [Telopea speciosissima]